MWNASIESLVPPPRLVLADARVAETALDTDVIPLRMASPVGLVVPLLDPSPAGAAVAAAAEARYVALEPTLDAGSRGCVDDAGVPTGLGSALTPPQDPS
jgi:hypothetical protein